MWNGRYATHLDFEAAVSSEASLLAAAQRLADAERRSDARALQELLAPDYAGYDPAGRPQDRSSVVRAYAEGSVRLKILEQSDLRARVMGEVGLVAGVSKLQGSQGAEFFDFRLRFLDVYAWRDGRWQLVASQDTYLSR
jgi:ketosteroid isomerase-like protein